MSHEFKIVAEYVVSTPDGKQRHIEIVERSLSDGTRIRTVRTKAVAA